MALQIGPSPSSRKAVNSVPMRGQSVQCLKVSPGCRCSVQLVACLPARPCDDSTCSRRRSTQTGNLETFDLSSLRPSTVTCAKFLQIQMNPKSAVYMETKKNDPIVTCVYRGHSVLSKSHGGKSGKGGAGGGGGGGWRRWSSGCLRKQQRTHTINV